MNKSLAIFFVLAAFLIFNILVPSSALLFKVEAAILGNKTTSGSESLYEDVYSKKNVIEEKEHIEVAKASIINIDIESRKSSNDKSKSNKNTIPGKKYTNNNTVPKLITICRPLKRGTITSDYGYRKHPITNKNSFHHGIDIACPIGRKVYAWRKGKIQIVKNSKGYGLHIIIKHENGIQTVYGHLSKVFVKRGDQVSAGAILGLSGNSGTSTGPHLHFEIRKNGKTINPASYIKKDRTYKAGDKLR